MVSEFKYNTTLMFLSVFTWLEIALMGRFNHSGEGLSMMSSWWMEDFICVGLCSLTLFITIMSLIASDDHFDLDKSSSQFMWFVSVLGLVCVVVFYVAKVLLFYFFFEVSLLPTLILILGWGNQPERLQAGLQMVIYTVCGSLPLLTVLGLTYYNVGSDSMMIMGLLSSNMVGDYNIFWFFVFVGVLVKVPVFSLHGWLPKAHVEAPVSGSMMLAGILLKLGIYGVCRLLFSLGIPDYSFILAVMVVSLWGGVVCSFLCLCFHDVKSVIAYSSIAHMAFSLVGIYMLSSLGWMGGVCMALAHGVCSPCLFSLANYTYSMTGSRSILLCKGMLKSLPSLSCMWFLFSAMNLGCPPSMNFFSECFLFCSIMGYSSWFVVPLFFLCFLAAGYSLFIYSSVNHGYQSMSIRSFGGLSVRFMTSMMVCVVVLFGMFIMLDVVFLC